MRDTGNASQALQPGALIPHQTCIEHPEQSYAVYLPAQYTASKKWPIVYAFDPAARGKVPVELMKSAAERYAYIVVGTNNSRNGSWKVEAEAAQAMLQDTHSQLSIDVRPVYLAGFSGGARVASQIAMLCKCAAGVILNGAGFPSGASPSRDAIFAVFSAVGNFDFNYPEVARLDQKLEDSGFAHAFHPFAWFRLIAIKTGSELRDDVFVASKFAEATTRPHALGQS